MTGCPLLRACLLAWRLGELSQQRVPPHSWQVRRCTQRAPIFTHSSHSYRLAPLTLLIALICAQPLSGTELRPAVAHERRVWVECSFDIRERHLPVHVRVRPL